MKHFNKLQTLLTDLLDNVLRRQWHVRCKWCRWTVRNLEHARFAYARGKLHHANAHGFVGPYNPVPANYNVWHTRA